MEKPDISSINLATQLRQVIQADRMAADLVNNAYDTKRSVEKKTAAEKQRILQEAGEKRRAALARVGEEQREELAGRKAAASQKYTGARAALKEEMEQGRDKWAGEMVRRILGAAQE